MFVAKHRVLLRRAADGPLGPDDFLIACCAGFTRGSSACMWIEVLVIEVRVLKRIGLKERVCAHAKLSGALRIPYQILVTRITQAQQSNASCESISQL